MRLRNLLPLLGAALVGRSLASGAQPPRIPVVGFLSAATMEQGASYLAA